MVEPAIADLQKECALSEGASALRRARVLVVGDRRGAPGLVAFTACLAYWMLMFGGDLVTRRGYLPVPIGAWLPNFALMATAIFVASSRQISVVKASD